MSPLNNLGGFVATQHAAPHLGRISYLLREGPLEAPKQKELAACVTAEDGKFCFRHLPPGKYELRASLNAGWNITHVYVVVDKKSQPKEATRCRNESGNVTAIP
jgi:hypothetical protein